MQVCILMHANDFDNDQESNIESSNVLRPHDLQRMEECFLRPDSAATDTTRFWAEKLLKGSHGIGCDKHASTDY